MVWTSSNGGTTFAYPDTLYGTDLHTTMVNGLGVLGWGVGGIEAEAAMLGQPIAMLIPDVIGFRLDREVLPEGATATDLVLTVTQMLRAQRRGRQVRGTITDRDWKIWHCRIVRRSATWRPNMARPAASSRSIKWRWTICA